jgi:serine/threonine protein kinase
MTIEPGQQLLHYRLIAKIGEGGMGVVYEATDTRLNRKVAIKVLPAGLTQNADRRARFQQEAQFAAAFNHVNIATVHDVGEDQGIHFIVMELVRGDSLRELIRRRPLPVERAIEIAGGIAAGLARAHREGVLHRDLKPDNVMLTDDGQPKILDFGLGKLIQEVRLPEQAETSVAPTATIGIPEADPRSPYMTREGQVVGTLSYMSPEQLQGGNVDARADVFSFGVVLYEMLAGGRPFGGNSALQTMTAILRDEPESLESTRPEVPQEILVLIRRCLEKDPAERFASGQELVEALERLSGHAPPPPRLSKNPAFRIGAMVVLAGLMAGVGWLALRGKRISWAHSEALPEIARLTDTGDWDGAMRLIREAADVIPEDPRLLQLEASALLPVTVESDPPGARVLVKGYTKLDREWIDLGTTPLVEVSMPGPARIRIELDGYLPFEGGLHLGAVRVKLYKQSEVPRGMVRVAAGAASFENAGPHEIDAFWIDRYEVTNEQFKAFVDDGAYDKREWWHEEVSSERVAELFVDSTGRPGPAGWELGSYPEGTATHPVHGISWYEAEAFARWSGKSLPTVFHWRQAAQQGIWSEIVIVSNFDGKGAAPVGSYDGVGPFGTHDMAGNVSEWCLNSAANGERYVLGGAWSEPIYRYDSTEAADPLDRSNIHGMRLIQTEGDLTADVTAPVEDPVYDFRNTQPIGDEAFEIIRGMYAYDRTPLDARVEAVEDKHEHWREEVVSIRAAYGDERIPIHLYLPRNTEPPYQTVVYQPGSDAAMVANSRHMRLTFSNFVPRSGRALVYPVYKGTYERRMKIEGQNDARDRLIYMVKDLRRVIDYLETRDDIDVGRLGFYGLSWGSTYAPVYTSIEDRFVAGVMLAGGLYLYPPERPPEALPANYTPRVTLPMLMINSRNDLGLPIDTNVKAMMDLFGTPEEHKKLVIIDGGHVPESPNEFIREALDWFDRYLGKVGG